MRCLFFSMLYLCPLASASATILISQPESALFVAATPHNSMFANKMGDTSVAEPSWFLAQWSNPAPFAAGASYNAAPGQNWTATTPTSSVSFTAVPGPQNTPQQSYTLSQNGSAAAAPLACKVEDDLFLSVNGISKYLTPAGLHATSRFASSAPLGSLAAVEWDFGLTISQEMTTPTCPLNYAGYLTAITLQSTTGLSMYYQIYLRDSRGNTPYNQVCTGYPKKGSYCFSTAASRIVSGVANQPVGTRVVYSVNILAPLAAAVATTTDPNLADWTVIGAYVGSLMQGGMAITSSWDSIMLQAY